MWIERMISPLPIPTNSKVKQAIGDFVQLHKRYQSLEMEPLIITGHMATGYVPAPDGTVHLDGLLGWAVLTSLPGPVTYPPDSAVVVPVPLRTLWVSETGLPLWAASPLMPASMVANATEYYHRRYPTDRADLSVKRAANTSAGRYKEARTPMPVKVTGQLVCVCIGNRAEIERLLAIVTHVGKKPSTGYGRVAEWKISPFGKEDAQEIILNSRPLPVECPLAEQVTGKVTFCGWTPPYWWAPWHAKCITGVV